MAVNCAHLDAITESVQASGEGCVECLRDGTEWVALRECLSCGHVGCCDSSEGKHAAAHFHETEHPIMQAFGGDAWKWCYVDEVMVG